MSETILSFNFDHQNLLTQFWCEKETETSSGDEVTEESTNDGCNFEFDIRLIKRTQWMIQPVEIDQEMYLYDELYEPTMIVNRFWLNPRLFLYHSKFCEIIHTNLSSFQLNDLLSEMRVIEEIAGFATHIANQESKNGEIKICKYRICMDLILSDVCIHDEQTMVDRALMESSTMVNMVSASQSSIDELEKIEVNGEFLMNTSCSVCLEEFERGLRLTKMPCSHVFHGDCITQWLQTSHYCPICRFQMPT